MPRHSCDAAVIVRKQLHVAVAHGFGGSNVGAKQWHYTVWYRGSSVYVADSVVTVHCISHHKGTGKMQIKKL